MKNTLFGILAGILLGITVFMAFPPKVTKITTPPEKLPCSSMIDSRCENYQPPMCHE